MMARFILDTCADVVEGQKEYITQFFRDVLELQDYKVVLGGTKMKDEIKSKATLLMVLNQLNSKKKIVRISDIDVDAKAAEIKSTTESQFDKIPQPCDDFHILGLASVSGCCNIVTKDTRMGKCVSQIRPVIGHGNCPTVRLIINEKVYRALKGKNMF
jgi:hypothetical protein